MKDFQARAYRRPCVFADEVPVNAVQLERREGGYDAFVVLNVGIGVE